MAAGLPAIPPGAMPPGGAPPPGGPPPMAQLAAARPSPPGAPMGMGGQMMQFLAGVGFQHFVNSIKKLQGGDKEKKPTQAGGLINNLGAAGALPQNAVTPGGPQGMPPMLQGGQGPGFLAMLAKLAAAAQGGGGNQ